MKAGLVKALLVLVFSPILVFAGEREDGLQFLEQNGKSAMVNVLESGLQYKALGQGWGDFHPTMDSPCKIHYHGKLVYGEVFHSTRESNTPEVIVPQDSILGWQEALSLMVEGDKIQWFIPAELAYGEDGFKDLVVPGAVVVYTLELLEILGDKIPADRCNPITQEFCSEKDIGFINYYENHSFKELVMEMQKFDQILRNETVKPTLRSLLLRRRKMIYKLAGDRREEPKKDKDQGVESTEEKVNIPQQEPTGKEKTKEEL